MAFNVPANIPSVLGYVLFGIGVLCGFLLTDIYAWGDRRYVGTIYCHHCGAAVAEALGWTKSQAAALRLKKRSGRAAGKGDVGGHLTPPSSRHAPGAAAHPRTSGTPR